MGILNFFKKQIIGEEGVRALERFPQWDKELKEHSYKKVKTATENRNLSIEGIKLRRQLESHHLLPFLDEKYVSTSKIGEKFLITYGPGLPTEKYFYIQGRDFKDISLTKEQKSNLTKFGFLEIFQSTDKFFEIYASHGFLVSRSELSEIILVLGGKKHQH